MFCDVRRQDLRVFHRLLSEDISKLLPQGASLFLTTDSHHFSLFDPQDARNFEQLRADARGRQWNH